MKKSPRILQLLFRRDVVQLMFALGVAVPLAIAIKIVAHPVSTDEFAMMVVTPLISLGLVTRVMTTMIRLPGRRKTTGASSPLLSICAWGLTISLFAVLSALGSMALFAYIGPHRAVAAAFVTAFGALGIGLVCAFCVIWHKVLLDGWKFLFERMVVRRVASELERDVAAVIEDLRDHMQRHRPSADLLLKLH